MEAKADIGLIGLAVMGQNLILNMNDHGFTVVAFNRTVSKVDDFLNKEAKGTKVIGAHSIEELVALGANHCVKIVQSAMNVANWLNLKTMLETDPRLQLGTHA